MRNLFQGIAIVLSLFLSTSYVAAADAAPYSYYFKGELVTMTPSTRYVAAKRLAGGQTPDLGGLGLSEATDIPQDGIKAKGYVIYSRAQAKDKSVKAAAAPSPRALVNAGAGEAQPVFEQGWAIMLPTDRIIVGLSSAGDLDAARTFLTGAGLGIREVLPHRKNTYIGVIDNPGDGRVYQVVKTLSGMPGVTFAEPDHLMILDRGLKNAKPVTEPPLALAALAAAKAERASAQPSQPAAAPGWTVVASMDAETSNVPYGTQVGVGPSATSMATWSRTAYRSHAGSYSYYCAGSGVAAPGPTPTGMAAYFYFPLNLSAYEEVYLEFWFYAKNEVYNGTPYDFGQVAVIDGDTLATAESRYLLNNGPEGDMTIDPTTANGWRHCLLRIPPAARKALVYLHFEFKTDSSASTEGLYLDDIRVVGTTNVDTEPLGSDPFAGRQYELRNVGQVAGFGTTANDLNVPEAWADTPGPYTPLVAVIDDGVELSHPDLNLVQGYDWNGSLGGGPKNDSSNHGTACAGNVGARANTIGVRGTAPGVPIMPVEALGSATQQSDLAGGIDVAVAHGATVLSNSWGWVGVPVQNIVNAIQDALNAGRVVVFAAGNGPDRPPYTYDVAFPGNQTGTLGIITVGASSMTDEHKAAASSDGLFNWGSSYVGNGPDVMAPGPWSYTTDRQGSLGYNNGSEISDANYTATFGGTSSSTPKVAGICALILKANPDLTPAQVKDILCSTAKDIGATGFDDRTGCGRVDALAAVRKAKTYNGSSPGNPGATQLLLLE